MAEERRFKSVGTDNTYIQNMDSSSRPPSDDGGGGGSDMEARIANLESDVENINKNINDIKLDIREMRSGFKSDFNDLRSDFKSGLNDLRSDFKSDFNGLRSELKNDFNGIRMENQALREDVNRGFNDVYKKIDSLSNQFVDVHKEMGKYFRWSIGFAFPLILGLMAMLAKGFQWF